MAAALIIAWALALCALEAFIEEAGRA